MIITCKELVKRVTDAREGHLSAVDRAGYELHLLRCKHCRRYVAQVNAIVELLHDAGVKDDAGEKDAAPAQLHEALAAALHTRKR